MAGEAKSRRQIVEIGDWLHERGFVAGTEGNISARLSGGRILTTPTGVSKRGMRSTDLVLVELDGERLRKQSSRRNASSEIATHLTIYRARPDVNAVVHAHPPTATGFAVAGRALEQPLLPEIVVALKSIPLVPYATPGSRELSELLKNLITDHDAVLLANHGVVTCGSDLNDAYLKMEMVEQFAKIVLAAEQAGEPRELPEGEVKKLRSLRAEYFARIGHRH